MVDRHEKGISDPHISKSIVANSLVWKILERLFSQGGNLIIQIILARLLLPSDFGSLAIIMAIINYLSIFVQSGLSAALIQKKNLREVDVSTMLAISMVISTVLYIGVYLSAPLISNYYGDPLLLKPIRVTGLVLFLYALNSIQVGLLSRNMDFKVIFIRSIIAVPFAGCVAIIMAYKGLGIWALIANLLINIALSTAIMMIGSKVRLRLRFSYKSAKALYSFSIKIMGANIISGFCDLLRTTMIGKRYSVSELAFYDKATTYSSLITQIVGNSIQSVLLPVFSRQQESLENLKNTVRRSIGMSMFGLTPILLGLFVIAKPFVVVLLTEKWLPCVPYLMLFCLFRYSGSIVGIDKQALLAINKGSILFYYEFLLLIANVTMLFITIPISVMAIAIGAIIVEYSANFVLIIISRRVYGYTLTERFVDLLKPLLSSIGMMVGMYAITYATNDYVTQLVVQIIVGLIIYFVMSKILNDNNLKYIFEVINNKFYKN